MTERRKTICRACHHFCSVEAESETDVHAFGSNPARLLATDAVYDPYSGQPRMSAIPVRITPHPAAVGR